MTKPEPKPTLNVYGKSEPVFSWVEHFLEGHPQLLAELEKRRQLGTTKYGTELHTFNGRNAANDYREELLDAIQYLVQHIIQLEQVAGNHLEVKVIYALLTKLIECMDLPNKAIELIHKEG